MNLRLGRSLPAPLAMLTLLAARSSASPSATSETTAATATTATTAMTNAVDNQIRITARYGWAVVLDATAGPSFPSDVHIAASITVADRVDRELGSESLPVTAPPRAYC